MNISRDEELNDLRKRLAKTEQERDFLRDAAVFFAKESKSGYYAWRSWPEAAIRCFPEQDVQVAAIGKSGRSPEHYYRPNMNSNRRKHIARTRAALLVLPGCASAGCFIRKQGC